MKAVRERVPITYDEKSRAYTPTVLTVSQAASWLEIGKETAYRRIKKGDFAVRVRTISGRRAILTADLMKYLSGAA